MVGAGQEPGPQHPTGHWRRARPGERYQVASHGIEIRVDNPRLMAYIPTKTYFHAALLIRDLSSLDTGAIIESGSTRAST